MLYKLVQSLGLHIHLLDRKQPNILKIISALGVTRRELVIRFYSQKEFCDFFWSI